ncbi:MAG: hypothetical protein HYR91_04575 [Flavobacteriia bacterium]|nr:hypothetical protein [Flavobacteriia bacterium]
MKLLFTLLFFIPLCCFGQQKLKKKYLGSYTGNIPAYKMDSGKEIINVDSIKIEIEILADGLIKYAIGNMKYNGQFKIEFEGETFFYLIAVLENQLAEEKIKIFIKDKHIEREGIYPQPTAILTKLNS